MGNSWRDAFMARGEDAHLDPDLKRRVEDLEEWLFGADAAWNLGGPETWEEQLLKPKDRLEQAAALKKRVGGLRDDESLHLAGTVNPWTPFQLRLLFRAWNAAWDCLASEARDEVTSRLASELRSAASEDKAALSPATGTAGPGSRLAVRACQCGLDLLERKPGGLGRKRAGGKVRSGGGKSSREE
jgi:hypothetical protein